MSREIEELRALARAERVQLREIGGRLGSSAAAEVRGLTARHRRTALAIALGVGFLGVRTLTSGGGRAASPRRGLARASLGAVAALAVKVLPSILLQAASAKGGSPTGGGNAVPPAPRRTPTPTPNVAPPDGPSRPNSDAATLSRSPVPTPAP
ncbi:MAG: hypothetical protein GC161_02625 [Planctomycetaceae bacterium]|nr:hypothetical protein [Planctomycetaceae bacterium]